jgi:hypothetical protein
MRILIPLLLLFAVACGDDTTTPHQLPPDLGVGVTCGASTCQPAEICCPGQCGDPKPFCINDTFCSEASCDLGRTTDQG